VDITENNPDNTFKVFAYELLGAVYEHTGEIREAVQAYQEALKLNLKGSNPMSFSLMERYRLACAKLNRS
jgi:cytochrome c-type biogenesis protein CcmH/NrfG